MPISITLLSYTFNALVQGRRIEITHFTLVRLDKLKTYTSQREAKRVYLIKEKQLHCSHVRRKYVISRFRQLSCILVKHIASMCALSLKRIPIII